MLDRRTIQAMPTRQLLQTHASFVATVEQADAEIDGIQREIQDREQKIAEVNARTASLRTLSEMTYAQLIQNGYDDDSLASSIAIVNQAIDAAIGVGDDQHDHQDHLDHQDHHDHERHRQEPDRAAGRGHVEERHAEPSMQAAAPRERIEPRPQRPADERGRQQAEPPSIFTEIEDGGRRASPHPLRPAARQRSFEDLAGDDADALLQTGGFGVAPGAFAAR